MKMQLKENVEFRNLTVNCNTFKEKVSELVEQFGGKVAFVFKSEVMHQISKKGLCKYYTEGYTADDGICMMIYAWLYVAGQGCIYNLSFRLV